MAEHALSRETYQVAFDPSVPPALEIDPGDTVTFETGSDAYERLAGGESVDAIGLPNFNRVTGPVAVRGASPGDALAIEVLDVQVRKAFSVWLPGFGGLGGRTDEQRVMETPLEDGRAVIGTDGVSVPIRPMIGCIGTAPAEGSASTFMPAYPFGGNMDLREMEPGTTLYLPVNVPGGLLSMGDLHAAMGTAEPTWVSLEAAGQATLRIGVEKGLTPGVPAAALRRRDLLPGHRRELPRGARAGARPGARPPRPRPRNERLRRVRLRQRLLRHAAGRPGQHDRDGRPTGGVAVPAPRCDCAHEWRRERLAVPARYRCRRCGCHLFRRSTWLDGEDEYSIWCDCGGESWCAWPNCVAVTRGPWKRARDRVRSMVWTITGEIGASGDD